MASNYKIDSPTSRSRLPVRREPYWRKLAARGYLGFRRTGDGGAWVARWRGEDGKQRYRALKLPMMAPADEYQAAEKAARDWFKETKAGIFRHDTVADAARTYAEALRIRKGEKAARDAEGRINRCILPALGSRPLDALRTSELDSWLFGLIPDKGGDETIRKAKDSANRNLTTLKAILNHAWKQGRIASNQEWSRVKRFNNVSRARQVFLSIDQRKRLLAACDGAFRSLVEAAMLTGCRYGELRVLLVSDFDAARKLLSIRSGKTGARDIPLSDVAAQSFRSLTKGKLPRAYLLTRDDGQPWAHSDQDELMREAAKKARLPHGTVFYTLRHSFIAQALTGGLDIHALAKITGTSVQMIEKHYGKLLHADVTSKLNAVSFI